MLIIQATKKEIPDIVLLNSFVQKIHHENHPKLFKPLGNDDEIRHFFESVISKEHHHVFVAYEGDIPVGYARAAFEKKQESALEAD